MRAMFLSIFLSVIPERYRGRWLTNTDISVQRGAIISGALQILLFLALSIYWYFVFFHARMNSAAQTTFGERASSETQFMASGALAYIEFLIQPLTLILLYFAFEGALRCAAAVVSNEVVPSLPFQTISWMHSLVNRKKHHSWMGERIADKVSLGDGSTYALRIESCRPKPWDMMMTIAFKDAHYEVALFREQGPPRRFVYLLRLIPANKMIRGLHHYDVEEELHLKD